MPLPHTFARPAALAALLLAAGAARAADLSLAGDWRVLLDRDNSGESHQWHTPAFWDGGKDAPAVRLPGSIQSQKIGDLPALDSPWTARIGMNLLRNPKYAPYQKPGEFKTPFWLTPERVYVGAAWFNRTVSIPPAFNGQRVTLTLERPHWETTLWVDGKQAGPSQNSLGTPHVYDLTALLGPSPAGNHTLILRVDNRIKIPVGMDASSVTDQTQSNWNGVVGDLTLSSSPPVWLDDVQIYPDLANKKIHVKAAVGNRTNAAGRGTLALVVNNYRGERATRDLPTTPVSVAVTWDASGGHVEADYALGDATAPWSEFSPRLYDLQATLTPDAGPADRRTTTFGMREISAKGTQLLLNGKPLYLRGTLECAIFPLTGYPPTGADGAAYWRKIYTQLKAYGLNHLRFHSWCPPEVAFQVADELGIYLQIEGSAWAAFGSSGRPPTTEPEAPDAGGRGGASLDTWIVKEADAMLKAYGNHPSFVFMAAANEPGSRNNQPNATFLSALVTKWKAQDPRHLYTAGSNWPNVPVADFQVMSPPRMNSSGELNRPPQTESTYARTVAAWPMPIVSHETGQWCVYPDFNEIKKYTGALRPGNLEIFQDFLAKAGMADQARDFLMASGKFQALLYKEEIEALLRTPNIGGFQLLDLHDFPGQGTAPIGVVDAFWDEKPYITPAEYKRFAGPTVPLALLPKRVFTTDDTLTATVQISHFGPADLPAPNGTFGTTTRWRLVDDTDKVLQEGTLPAAAIPAGKLSDLGKLEIPLKDVSAPARLRLLVQVATVTAEAAPAAGRGPNEHITTAFTNDWDVWVYPSRLATPTPANVTLATKLDDATLAALNNGGTVLLLPGPAGVAGNAHGSFAPIFWNRITFPDPNRQHTVGLLCDPKHPAFAAFPTDFYANWQWSDLLLPARSKPMILDGLPADLKPLVQMIDDWDSARKLGLLVEANVGRGKLLICTIDLQSDLTATDAPTQRPAARQFLASLLSYMQQPSFNPKTTLSEAQVRSLLK
jgi:hypothetical protein